MSDITVVDENDLVVGQGDYREVRRTGKRHRVSAVVLFNSKREVLLQLRSQHVHEAPGKWDVSAGGHVDPGEGYHDAVVKELREELGLTGLEITQMGKTYDEFREAEEWIRRFGMTHMAVTDKPVQIEPEEVASVRWVSIEELGDWIDREPDELTRGMKAVFRLYLKPMIARS